MTMDVYSHITLLERDFSDITIALLERNFKKHPCSTRPTQTAF